jgi:hypothetical protein
VAFGEFGLWNAGWRTETACTARWWLVDDDEIPEWWIPPRPSQSGTGAALAFVSFDTRVVAWLVLRWCTF